MAVDSAIGARRSPPIVDLDRCLARARIVSQLAERFSRRIVTLVAHAGSGKTTSLALALEANRIDPWGHDVWVALDRRDDDPDQLLGAIADALGASTGGSSRLDAIIDAIWAVAPSDVALVLDDVHVLRTPEALHALGQLIRELPGNGHVVLASRERLALPLARFRAQFEVLELDADDLALDPSELAALVELRCRDAPSTPTPDIATLPRVAALADLTVRFGSGAGAQFVWDEVLASFAAPELEALRRLSLVGVFDESLAEQVARSTGVELALDDLALLNRDEDGRLEMHDLLRSALLDPLTAHDRAELAAATAVDAERAGDRSLAVMLFADSGDARRAQDVARAFIMTASLRRTYEQIKRVSQSIDRFDADTPLARFLQAELRSGHDESPSSGSSQAAEFGAVADAARAVGDDEVEAAASYRCHQQSLLELLPFADDRIDRLAALAPRVPYAAQVLRFARARQHLRRGDSGRAWAEIVDLDDVADPQSEQVFRAGLMCLLGRFDEVVDEFGAVEAGSLAPGVDEYVAYALYLSGRINPELAAPMFEEVSEGIGRAELAQTSVLLFTTGALISIHVGDHDLAAQHLAAAHRVTQKGCAPSFATNVDTAAAVLALVVDDENAARETLDESLQRVPIDSWPNAAHLTILPLIYVLFPDVREQLDACDFGRPATVARDAGRALVDVRSGRGADAALGLPWDEPDLLRVQVPPPLLTELAVVAAVAGDDDAGRILSVIPFVDRWLRRCARGAGSGAESATRILQRRPRVPDVPLQLTTLGPVTARRGGIAIEHPDLFRRGKVQQLLGLLADRRSIVRAEAAALLWPEHEPRAASNNLRVTLSYLNRALEPDRDPEDPPIYVTQKGETIGLHPEVKTDLDAFRASVRNGRSHARRRSPRSALESYRQAAELYAGEFVAGQDAVWLAGVRDQARFDAIHTFVRLGELSLAIGEPEEAIGWGLRARDSAERHDRVERLIAKCMLATGDRSGATETLRRLVDLFRADGIEPDIETVRLLDRTTI